MEEVQVIYKRDALSEEDLDAIMSMAHKLSDLYGRTGFISIDSMHRPSVHLTEEAFKDTFNEWQEQDFSDSTIKLVYKLENVEFFALHHLPEPEVQKEEKVEETLPAVQMDNKRIDIISMLIDFYRLRQQPEEDLDRFLTGLKRELESVRQ